MSRDRSHDKLTGKHGPIAHHFEVRFSFMLLLCACSLRPPLARVPLPTDAPPADPAYLGEASGIYQLRRSNAPVLRPGERFFVAELEGTIMFSLASSSGDMDRPALTFVGPLTRDASGVVAATGTFSLIDKSLGVLEDRASLNTSLGEGVVTLDQGGPFSAMLGCPNGQCTFAVQKVCDFDSTISGIYEMHVELQESAGDCSAASDLSGDRQWGLTTINSTGAATLIALDGKTINMALSMTLDRLQHTLRIQSPLPTPDGARWDPTSSQAELSLDVTDDGLTLRSIVFVRALPGGCVQSYVASGTRARGAEAGVPCEQQSELSCGFDVSACPAVPRGSHPWEITLRPDATATNGANALCPGTTCEYRTTGRSLCDFESRLIAGSGCARYTGRGDTSVSVTYGAMSCAKLECVPNLGNCGQSPQPGDILEPCTQTDLVVLTAGDQQCIESQCRGVGPSCAPLVDCSAFGLASLTRVINGCLTNVCQIAAAPAQFTLAESAVLAGRYHITGFTSAPQPPPTSGSRPIFVPAAANAPACPPFPLDRYAGVFQCPKSGQLSGEVCPTLFTPTVIAESPFRIGVARRTQGLCLELYNATNGEPVGLPFQEDSATGCGPSQALCCTRLAPPAVLACVANPASPKQVNVRVTNTFPTSVGLDVVGGLGFNTRHAVVGPSGVTTVSLPLAISQSGGNNYLMSVQNESAPCVFTASLATTMSINNMTDLDQPIDVRCQ